MGIAALFLGREANMADVCVQACSSAWRPWEERSSSSCRASSLRWEWRSRATMSWTPSSDRFEAMKASWVATMGHKGSLFGLFLAGVGLSLLGLLMLGVLAATGSRSLWLRPSCSRESPDAEWSCSPTFAPPPGWPLVD